MANRTLARRSAASALLALLPAAAGASAGLTTTIPAPQQAPPIASAPSSSVIFAPPGGSSVLPGPPSPRRIPAKAPTASHPGAPQEPGAPAAAAPAEPPAAPARPGVRVLPTGGIKMETAALLVSGQEGGPVPLAAVAYPFPGEAGRARVAVVVEIEGAALLAKESAELLRAEVVLYALDAQGALAGSAERTVEVDLTQLGGEVRDGGLKVLTELSLPPGSVSLRILARNVGTGDMGIRVLPLVVPAFSGPALVAPVLLASRDPWLVVAAGAAGRPGPLAAVLPGAAGEGGAELPAALPILTPGREVKAEVPAFQMGAAPEVHLDVLGSAGRVADLPARIVARRPTAVPGLEVMTVAFTPLGFPEGRYALRARAGEAASGVGQFLLLPDGGGGRAWAELTALSRAQANGEAPATEKLAAARAKARRRKPATAAILAAYQQALGRLAGGDAAGASAAIADLEVKALTGEEMLTEPELRELELDAVHAWEGGGGDRLTQVLTVYELLYRDAWNRQRFLTAGHAGEMVIHLVDLYVKSGAQDARRVGAELLVALTPRATGAGLSDLVVRALHRALDLDRDGEAALLCLAVDAERRGRYADAVRWLERLVKAHPDNREARLRLALNLEKQGHREDAARRLRALAEERAAKGEAADWIAAVAWQELARAEIADRQLERAERTLAAGLARFPGDEKLELERAYLLDLRGQPGRAEEALGPDRSPAPSTSGSSARLRYDELPQELLDRIWEDVRHGLAVRFPSLAAILNAPERSAGVLP